MENSSQIDFTVSDDPNFDRINELKAFDQTKAGVKGLVDAGTATVPRIFYSPPDGIGRFSGGESSIPFIDLDDVRTDAIRRADVVERIRDASGRWGVFPGGESWNWGEGSRRNGGRCEEIL